MRVLGHGQGAVRARETTPVPDFIGDGARRYELVREISRGGMGMVHLGRLRGPLGFAKNVAIKTMHARDVSDPQVASMFAAEARLTARLCHANIVSTLDVLVEHGSVFIVMEYIDGHTLAQLVGVASDFGALLPVEVSCAIMHDVLLGLEHAHNAGVIHCDISPQNILVGTDGLARILDFGIAKVIKSARDPRGDADDTIIRGKVPYMAPEQLRGASMDHRVDLYAAGATLWELLTGMRLFRGANRMQIAANVLTGSVEPPSAHLGEVTRGLDALVLKATARDPRQRFRSAREMANALASAVPLASREDVVITMRRLDTRGTPGSGVRALSPAEIAVRNHARAVRNANLVNAPVPAPAADLAPVLPTHIPFEEPAAPPPRAPSPSSVERRKSAASSLRVRLATLGLLGVALGAGQATFNFVPVDRLLPAKAHVTNAAPKPKPVPIATAVQPAAVVAPPPASVAPLPSTVDSSKPRGERPRGPRVDVPKPRR